MLVANWDDLDAFGLDADSVLRFFFFLSFLDCFRFRFSVSPSAATGADVYLER
jgi:hypothetical protein